MRREPEPLERGQRHHDRVVAELVALAQPGLDVAAQRPERQIGARGGELGAPADRTGADTRARTQVVERDTGERVARIAALRDRREQQPGRGLGREILGRVHGDVGPTVEHGLLHLFREHALAADRVEVRRLIAVARRRDQHVLDVVAVRATQELTDPLRLPARERAGAGRDSDHSLSTEGSVGRSKSDASASA